MLDLFLSTASTQVTTQSDPAFHYLRAAYRREVADVVSYYHQRVYAVKNNHFLARLLNTLAVPMEYEIAQYARVAETRGTYVANSFRMTSELTAGTVFDGHFYGPGGSEIILHRDCYFDPVKADLHWPHIAAVHVHRHPQSHLGFLLPNGRETCSETGVSVVSVNVGLLAVQYRGFILQQYRKTAGVSLLGLNHFIHMYVLPNMLYRHADYVLMNRLMNLYYGAPLGQAYRTHPFLLYDYHQKLDQSLGFYLKRLQKKSLDFSSVLKSLPALYTENQEEALQLPDYAPTRQVEWALLVARLPTIQFLIDLMGSNAKARNQMHLNTLDRLITRLLRDQSIQQALSPDLAMETTLQLEGLRRTIRH